MNVDKTQFIIIRSLGNGSYGQVKLLKHKQTEAIYAAKYGKITNQFARATYNELGILKYLTQISNSPAVELIDYFEDDDNIVLLLKKYPHDFKGLQRLKVFDQVYITQIVFVFKSLAVAVSTLHELNCVHRDLKSSNVLLDEQGCSHIADFGLAKYNINFSGDELVYSEQNVDTKVFKNVIQTRTICTLIYRSPEQLFAYDDDNKSISPIYSDEKYFDLFSQGIIYLEILYNQFCIQIKSDCKNSVQAVKYLYVMIYGKELIEMCKIVYKKNEDDAKQFLVKQFGEELRNNVAQLLNKNPVDLKALITAILTLRFKENMFYTSIYKNIQQFIIQFASLLSCIPFSRENPVNCDLFRVDSQDIATNLPEEALDNLVQTNNSLCSIDAEIQQLGFKNYNSFTDAGGRFAFQSVVANQITRIFHGNRTYKSYAEVVNEFKKIRGAKTK